MGKQKQAGGVELVLEPETEIPDWVLQSRYVETGQREIQGRALPVVRIKRGEASFVDAHSFIVMFPGSGDFRKAFDTPRVLEIRDLEGNVLKSNNYLCKLCFANTGKFVSDRAGRIAGRVERTFRCTRCGSQWERTI